MTPTRDGLWTIGVVLGIYRQTRPWNKLYVPYLNPYHPIKEMVEKGCEYFQCVGVALNRKCREHGEHSEHSEHSENSEHRHRSLNNVSWSYYVRFVSASLSPFSPTPITLYRPISLPLPHLSSPFLSILSFSLPPPLSLFLSLHLCVDM